MGLFAAIPANFFSPLVWSNREHYAALLVRYYRLFQENAHGILREQVVREFENYLSIYRTSINTEEEDDDDHDEDDDDNDEKETDRAMASRFLRKLITSGWLSEEMLSDYSRVINITPYGRPFLEALAHIDEGLKTEYESHVVASYSLLCTDAVAENGHYAVLNAHGATQALIDSLKVLSQSIKSHYESLRENESGAAISGILHLHYDLYAGEILDGAYKRLKTSDNLSRYRPRIIKKVAELLSDEPWLIESARKLSRNNSLPQEDSRRRLENMLHDIRDTLRAVDPLLEDIDRRNMLYARSSIERVKALLEPDSTIAGKLGQLVRDIYNSAETEGGLRHHLHRIRTINLRSLFRRYKRETPEFTPFELVSGNEEWNRNSLDKAEAEFFARMQKQLSVKKIRDWLDAQGGGEKILCSRDLIKDEDSFIHFIYAVLYADARPFFEYELSEGRADADETESGLSERNSVALAGFIVPDVHLRRKTSAAEKI
ncbi:MAG: hypothetical protein Ta2B_00820 [Termitinemataceae bacterium]|nr:MAG: hypothetical protein Ta2B_00820 [Termitinemataceae bacterium]